MPRGRPKLSGANWDISNLNRTGRSPKTYREAGYIRKLLKTISPNVKLSVLSSDILVSYVRDFQKRLYTQAVELMTKRGKTILKARDVQVAVRLLLKGELSKHAVVSGMTAVNSAESKKPKEFLTFPPSYTKCWLTKNSPYKLKVSKHTFIYTVGVIEYLVSEILELSANRANENRSRLIKPNHVNLAIQNDEELSYTFKDCIIPRGGVPPSMMFGVSMISKKKFHTARTGAPPLSFGSPQPFTLTKQTATESTGTAIPHGNTFQQSFVGGKEPKSFIPPSAFSFLSKK